MWLSVRWGGEGLCLLAARMIEIMKRRDFTWR